MDTRTRSIWRDQNNFYGMNVLSWLPQNTREQDVTVTIRRSSSCVACHTYRHADNLTVRRLKDRADVIRIEEGPVKEKTFDELLEEKRERVRQARIKKTAKRVRMLDMTGKLITVFDSQVQAARVLHMSRYAIRDRILGKVKDSNGFIFEEVTEDG